MGAGAADVALSMASHAIALASLQQHEAILGVGHNVLRESFDVEP